MRGLSSGSPRPQDGSGCPWRAPSTHLHPSSLPSAPARPPTSRAAGPRPRAETGCTGLSFAMQTPTQAQVSRDKSTITYCPSSPPNISTRLWRSREGPPSSAQPPRPRRRAAHGGHGPTEPGQGCWEAPQPGLGCRESAEGRGRSRRTRPEPGRASNRFPDLFFNLFSASPLLFSLPWLCPAGLVQAGGGTCPAVAWATPTHLPTASHPPHRIPPPPTRVTPLQAGSSPLFYPTGGEKPPQTHPRSTFPALSLGCRKPPSPPFPPPLPSSIILILLLPAMPQLAASQKIQQHARPGTPAPPTSRLKGGQQVVGSDRSVLPNPKYRGGCRACPPQDVWGLHAPQPPTPRSGRTALTPSPHRSHIGIGVGGVPHRAPP